jgi:hypothetical protein
MTRDEALKKIKKCLALAKSSNPNEAATAMRQAQKLMEAFGVNDDDVRLSDVNEQSASARMQSMAMWEVMLANAIASTFGVECFWKKEFLGWTRSGAKYKRFIFFVGLGSSTEIATYAWDVLSRQCAKARLAHIRSQPSRCKPITLTARGDVFAEGWVMGVKGKLSALATTSHQKELVQKFIETKHPEMEKVSAKDRSVGRNVSNNDRYQGLKQGLDASLNRGVGGVAKQGVLA